MRLPALFTIVLACTLFTACESTDVTAEARVIRNRSSSSASSVSSSVSSIASSSSAIPGPRPDLSTLKIPVLVYHHIRDTKPWHPSTWSWKMSVSPNKFEEQMQWLKDHGYETVSLNDLVAIYKGEIYGPAKPVVITFDDNQLSSYDIGVPIMVERGQTATFYLIMSKLDDPGSIGRAQIPSMLKAGMQIQSHTMTHANLTNLGRERLDHELTESRRVLEEVTGEPVLHIAYPLTAHNALVRERTKAAGYVTGTIMDPRPATSESDLFKLPRIMMTDTTDLTRVLP